jgi:hypothetical protein
MNFALSAIIIAILLTPGSTALRAYYTSWRRPANELPLSTTELLFKGFIYSFAIQTVALLVINLFWSNIRIDVLYNVIMGKDIKLRPKEFTNFLLEFFLYHAILIVITYVAVKGLKRFIRNRDIDLSYPFLSPDNYWGFLFSGRYLQAPGVQGDIEDADIIIVDLLTNKDIIYTGLLVDYQYDAPNNTVANFVLQDIFKRTFIKAENDEDITRTTGSPQPVKGDIMVIPMSEIVNINIGYLKLFDPPQTDDLE